MSALLVVFKIKGGTMSIIKYPKRVIIEDNEGKTIYDEFRKLQTVDCSGPKVIVERKVGFFRRESFIVPENASITVISRSFKSRSEQ